MTWLWTHAQARLRPVLVDGVGWMCSCVCTCGWNGGRHMTPAFAALAYQTHAGDERVLTQNRAARRHLRLKRELELGRRLPGPWRDWVAF
jgi:hypothetical protein